MSMTTPEYLEMRDALVTWVRAEIRPTVFGTLTVAPRREDNGLTGYTQPGVQFIRKAMAELRTQMRGWHAGLFYAIERGSVSDRIHVHYVARTTQPMVFAGRMRKVWTHGFINTQIINSEGAVTYCCKYAVKSTIYDAELDYDMWRSEEQGHF